SVRTAVYSCSAVLPPRNVDQPSRAPPALPSASNRIATPHQRASPGGMEPRSFANAFFWSEPLQLGCIVNVPPLATVVYALALQLDTSAPPIGAYTSTPPPGPFSVAVCDVVSHATLSLFASGASGLPAEPILKLWIEYAVTDCAAPDVFVTFSSITSALPSYPNGATKYDSVITPFTASAERIMFD